jgi:uncharacterized damage-inducible protein DinB
MQLQETAQKILHQISDLTARLSDAEYTTGLGLLHGNTLGKHVRHIIEFFEILIVGSSSGVINYDKRKHASEFEISRAAALQKLQQLARDVEKIANDKEVHLEVSYVDTDASAVMIKSSVERELAYNIEHTIHHMAIIKIAIQTVYPAIEVDRNFGLAYSTVRYQKADKSQVRF